MTKPIPSLKTLPPPPPDKQGWPWTEESQPTAQGSEECRLPRISIITPSYNQGEFIEETIRSVLLQGYPNLEYIIIDGGSQDESVNIIKKYDKHLNYWVSETDRGQSHALNKGFSKATGEILAWLCADDFYLKDALLSVGQYFRRNPESLFIYGKGYKINCDNSQILRTIDGKNANPKAIYNWCYICTPTAFWHRSLWSKAGGKVDEGNNYTMDWDLMIRMVCLETPVKIDQFITAIRSHTQSKTHLGVTSEQSQRLLEIVKVSRCYGGFFCFNSVVYALGLLKVARLSYLFKDYPKPVYSLVFFLSHLPILVLKKLYGNPKSNLLSD